MPPGQRLYLSTWLRRYVSLFFSVFTSRHNSALLSGQECNVSSSLTVIDNPGPHIDNQGLQNTEDNTTLAGIITVAFLGAVIIGIIVYFKFYRKFKRMKTELAHVHYIADPHIQPGKYFD